MTQLSSVVRFERQPDGVAVMTMQKEQTLNGLDIQLLVELLEKLKEAEVDDDIKVVILV